MIKKQEWQDISQETLRTYKYPDGGSISITRPLWLYISDNGHRVIDDNGTHHYVVKGWRHLMWDGGTSVPGETPEDMSVVSLPVFEEDTIENYEGSPSDDLTEIQKTLENILEEARKKNNGKNPFPLEPMEPSRPWQWPHQPPGGPYWYGHPSCKAGGG